MQWPTRRLRRGLPDAKAAGSWIWFGSCSSSVQCQTGAYEARARLETGVRIQLWGELSALHTLGLVVYALILVLVAILVVVILLAIGNQIANLFTNIVAALK